MNLCIQRLYLPLFKQFNSINYLYHTNVIDHYENPRNIGSLDKDDNNVGTGLVGAPACGDVMKLNIRVNDEGIITESKFISGIAISSMLHYEFVINNRKTEGFEKEGNIEFLKSNRLYSSITPTPLGVLKNNLMKKNIVCRYP